LQERDAANGDEEDGNDSDDDLQGSVFGEGTILSRRSEGWRLRVVGCFATWPDVEPVQRFLLARKHFDWSSFDFGNAHAKAVYCWWLANKRQPWIHLTLHDVCRYFHADLIPLEGGEPSVHRETMGNLLTYICEAVSHTSSRSRRLRRTQDYPSR
jgi:hypothetical protein